MDATFAVQILGVLFQTFGTILGITSAFYVYLLQGFQGKFVGYHGEDKDLRFENPSHHFWTFFGSTLFVMLFLLYFMFCASSGFFTEMQLGTAILVVLIVSGIDLVYFGIVIRDFSAYPTKLRRFLKKHTVIIPEN